MLFLRWTHINIVIFSTVISSPEQNNRIYGSKDQLLSALLFKERKSSWVISEKLSSFILLFVWKYSSDASLGRQIDEINQKELTLCLTTSCRQATFTANSKLTAAILTILFSFILVITHLFPTLHFKCISGVQVALNYYAVIYCKPHVHNWKYCLNLETAFFYILTR